MVQFNKKLVRRVQFLAVITIAAAILILALWSADLAVNGNRSSFDMIDVQEYIPGIAVELKYSSMDNVFGEAVYESNRAYLRRGTAEKLRAAQEDFQDRGLSLKLWDAYRPPSAQFKLWEIMPDRRFVANPYEGFSYHSRGVAVDVTLLDQDGRELSMPSAFDDFTPRADRDYSDVSSEQMDNACLLEKVMEKHGFRSIYYEWWHFTDQNRDGYPVINQDEFDA